MRYANVSCLAFFAFSAMAAAGIPCPAGTSPAEARQGNTRILSCLDSLGRPHGPFEVRAFPDTAQSGTGILIVEGRYHHGKQAEEWKTFAQDGRMLSRSRFVDGMKTEEIHAAE